MNTFYFILGAVVTIVLPLFYVVFSTRGYDPAEDIAMTIKHEQSN